MAFDSIMTEAEALAMCKVVYMPLDNVNGIDCSAVNGFAYMKYDGRILVAINSDKSPEIQEKALHHELAHIRLNHHFDPRPEAIKEAEAEALAAISY